MSVKIVSDIEYYIAKLMLSQGKVYRMKSENTKNTRQVVYGAVFIALVYVCTAFVNIRLPIIANGGLIHLGNVPLFIIAIVFGKKFGALAGGVGMALFDILSAWTIWAPFTFVIVGLMGFVVGLITQKRNSIVLNLLAIIAACAIKVVGYYLAEGIIYGNWIAPLASVPGNIVQIGVAAVIVLPFVGRIRKAASRINI